MKQRISFFDVAKGLLMLMVIYGHCMNWNRDVIMDKDIILLQPVQNIWQSFFMPAFFVVTGMCSNFDRAFKDFVIRNFKSLLIPCWVFTLLNPFELPNIHLVSAIKVIVLYGGDSVFWFLPTLFFSKVIYWMLRKYPPLSRSSKWMALFLLILSFSSIFLNEVSSIPNYYFFHQVFNLTIYLFIGEALKQYINDNKIMVIILSIYITIVCFLMGIEYTVPSVTRAFHCSIRQYPLYLILSVLGSISILQVSKWINRNSILEIIGRESLVVFIFQSYFLVNFMNIYKESFLAHGYIGSVFLLISTIVMDVISCLFMSWLLHRYYP